MRYRQNFQYNFLPLIALLSTLLLTACGGSSNDTPPNEDPPKRDSRELDEPQAPDTPINPVEDNENEGETPSDNPEVDKTILELSGTTHWLLVLDRLEDSCNDGPAVSSNHLLTLSVGEESIEALIDGFTFTEVSHTENSLTMSGTIDTGSFGIIAFEQLTFNFSKQDEEITFSSLEGSASWSWSNIEETSETCVGNSNVRGRTTFELETNMSDMVAQVVEVEDSNIERGDLTESSVLAARPTLEIVATNITTSNGSTALIPLLFSSENSLTELQLKVLGSDLVTKKPLNLNADEERLSLSVHIPSIIQPGNICFELKVVDSEGLVSDAIEVCLDILQLGSGALQFSLSWDTNQSDIDLHVREPNGEIIDYSYTYSTTGGQLDEDNTQGFGPENIFWEDEAPLGTYLVGAKFFSSRIQDNTTNINITITSDGNQLGSFTAVLAENKESKTIATVVVEEETVTVTAGGEDFIDLNNEEVFVEVIE